MAEFVKVAQVRDIPPGRGKAVEAGGRKIALFNVDGTFYAIDDACPHRGASLSEGELSGTEITCYLHGAVFDLVTGEVLAAPATEGVATYPVRIQGEDVEVAVP